MRVVLLSTYELGRQPFGLASAAAWLKRAGAEVTCADLAVESLNGPPAEAVRQAGLVALHLPMHTATRIAARVAMRVRDLNPAAHLCFFGLYAAMNEPYLRALGAQTVLSGEFEEGLAAVARDLMGPSSGGNAPDASRDSVSLARQSFIVPDRSGVPPLAKYARLMTDDGQERIVGYTEASRGCLHMCRHCPVVPVYQGALRIVQKDVVSADIRQQVEAGARHITFGDPDFFNGIGHSLAVVADLHREHPDLTYDVTIKVEHLLRHARHLPELTRTGCLFVTTAVESIEDRILALLEKGHTREQFAEALSYCRRIGLHLNPTFVPFTPWTSLSGYARLLSFLEQHDLVDHVASVQLAIRLLIPSGSRLMELPVVRDLVGPFDAAGLAYPWRNPDPRVDELQADIESLVRDGAAGADGRRETFDRVTRRVWMSPVSMAPPRPRALTHPRRAPIPYLTEPWYC